MLAGVISDLSAAAAGGADVVLAGVISDLSGGADFVLAGVISDLSAAAAGGADFVLAGVISDLSAAAVGGADVVLGAALSDLSATVAASRVDGGWAGFSDGMAMGMSLLCKCVQGTKPWRPFISALSQPSSTLTDRTVSTSLACTHTMRT